MPLGAVGEQHARAGGQIGAEHQPPRLLRRGFRQLDHEAMAPLGAFDPQFGFRERDLAGRGELEDGAGGETREHAQGAKDRAEPAPHAAAPRAAS